MTTVREILTQLERHMPPELRESWDNIGLLVGRAGQQVERVICALDVTLPVVEEAPAQAEMAEVLQEHLTQEELAVYRRGRNAKSHTTAKNASVLDYRKATGLEALYGWLYLSGQEERLLQLLRLSLDELGWKL